MGAALKSLDELLDPEDVVARAGDPSARIDHITHDSRLARSGTLFVAYRGVRQDVHAYIPDALRRGATAALVERPIEELRSQLALPVGVSLVQVRSARRARSRIAAALHGHPSRNLRVVGITGTDGKTTTCTLVHGIASSAGVRAGLVTTVGARTASETVATGLHTTTPEAEELQAMLAEMADAGLSTAVLEVTSHGLDQDRVADIAFDVAAVTNITREALEYHGTMEAYRAAKRRLFELAAASPTKLALPKTAVLNASDASFEALAAVPMARRITYSAGGAADFSVRQMHRTRRGLDFIAITPVGEMELRSPLSGSHNVANILAALAVAHALDIPPAAWPEGVAATSGIPGRMEAIDEGQSFAAVVDFAHTPNALRHALRTARELVEPGGRLIALFGCAGERDPGKRPAMGAVAADLADLTYVTAEDPRSESLDEIMAAIAEGLRGRGRHQGADFFCVADRFEAIRQACSAARPGDAVILCGKGHEQSMCFGQTEHPWDDRSALRAALRGERYGELPTAVQGE